VSAFVLRPAGPGDVESWVDGLRPGDVVLHARRGAPGERRSLRFRGPRRSLALAPGDDVGALLRELEAAVQGGHAIAGYLAYEAAAPLVGLPPSPPPPYALAWFGVYDGADLIDAGAGGTPLGPPAAPGGTLGEARLEIDAETWDARVAAARAALAAGDSYQVNLTTGFRCRVGDVREAYRALSAAQPVPFGALLDTGELQIASCSPELFVRAERGPAADGRPLPHRGLTVTARPMKGTAPRRADPEEDARAAAALRADPKSRAENVMIVDLLRHDLGRLALPGSVNVHDLLALEPYRTVWQLTSTIRAEARPDVGLAALLTALFPCGSVTGAPKRRTMELIAAFEGVPRGVYTGAIGFALPDGAGGVAETVWSVAIRTLVVQGGAGRLGVGGGIVIDSDAAAEHAELLAKGRFLTHPLPAPMLYETMRWSSGQLQRWARHRDRLARSAATLGIPFYADAAYAAARAAATEAEAAHAAAAAAAREAPAAAGTHPAQTAGAHPAPATEARAAVPPPFRVRLELHEDGALRAEARPHVEPAPDDAPLVVVWSDVPVRAEDAARRHKTLDRAAYDAASDWARASGVADVLFVNEDGRVAEGAISSVFVMGADGRWRTPPVADGALPGVLRAEMLDSGEAVEAPLHPDDLRTHTIAIGNALRGLRPVTLDETRRWRPGLDPPARR
jgi:para-aminobenzoate synthetase / 4-amino-4-deoxychorismate lyase